MSVFHTNALAGASGRQGAGGGAAQYQIQRSLRFNSADSAYLSLALLSVGNRKKWTWSGWVKRSALGSGGGQSIFAAFPNTTNGTVLRFTAADELEFFNYISSVYTGRRISTSLYRDPSAWYHIVLVWDSANATTANRIRLYVNGSELTAFSTSGDPNSSDSFVNANTAHYIGGDPGFNSQYVSGYLADIHFIDGQALTPTSFGQTDATTGEWVPIAYAGTYGTNGFKLNFSNNSAATATTLGADSSGNGNNWTPNNLSASDGSVDSATGAKPIYNTSGYGNVKKTGVRTDANASSLVLAIPMDSFVDESANIRGSGSAKSITNNSVTTSTLSRFYGNSGSFNGSSSSLALPDSADFAFGTGDFTVECWVYQTSSITYPPLLEIGEHGLADSALFCSRRMDNSSAQPGIYSGAWYQPSSSAISLNTWTHIAFVRASGVLKIYVNGVGGGTIAFTNNLSVSSSSFVGASGPGIQYYFPGYLQDLRIYKGVAKYTSDFSLVNYSLAVGCDSLIDSPTSYGTDTGFGAEVRGNYCTLNPLDKGSSITLSNGNLDYSGGASSNTVRATFQPKSGKWYWEASGDANTIIGISASSDSLSVYPGDSGTSGRGYNGSNGASIIGGGVSATWATFTSTDVIGLALDVDAGTCAVYKNNSLQGTWTGLVNPVPAIGRTTGVASVNFGQRPFAYTAPSGFKALCDTNLPAPTIVKPSTVMDVKLYAGNSSTQTISGLGFSPDLVWLKQRATGSTSHALYDVIRGGTLALQSDTTAAEQNLGFGNSVTFNSDGFTLGADTGGWTNFTGRTYVGWCWDAGSSTVVNSQGTLGGSIRANASAGFSIVQFVSPSAGNGTVGHGLGVAPSLIIAKNQVGNSNWTVYHSSATTISQYLALNGTSAVATLANVWGNASPTSTVFGINSSNQGGSTTCIAYCFAPVAGYSAFGSYTGNGSADGPFVYTGFRPRWVMVKCSSAATNWRILDVARDTYNAAGAELYPNLPSQEQGGINALDLTSNGFKVRINDSAYNTNTGTYIYAAFAEFPFQYSRGR